MATYSLNPNGLLDSSTELRGVTSSIAHTLDTLNGYVRQFIAANAGGAAEQYKAAQDNWNGGLIDMQHALNAAAVALDNIRETYHIADVRGAALFGGHV